MRRLGSRISRHRYPDPGCLVDHERYIESLYGIGGNPVIDQSGHHMSLAKFKGSRIKIN